MKITDSYTIEISAYKLTDYLLNFSHPDGWSKAKFFNELKITTAQELQNVLLTFATANEISKTIESSFGKKFIVDGALSTGAEKIVTLRTVWIVLSGEYICKFVTAYPI